MFRRIDLTIGFCAVAWAVIGLLDMAGAIA